MRIPNNRTGEADPPGGGAELTSAEFQVGVVRRLFFDGHSGVIEVVEAAIDTIGARGATIVELDLPDIGEAAAALDLMSAEAAVRHGRDLHDRPEAFSDEVRAKLESDRAVTTAGYIAARHFHQGVPNPPPPGVSISSTSPGCSSVPATPASSSTVPSARIKRLCPSAPGCPPAIP